MEKNSKNKNSIEKWNVLSQSQESNSKVINNKNESSSSTVNFTNTKAQIINQKVTEENYRTEIKTQVVTNFEVETNLSIEELMNKYGINDDFNKTEYFSNTPCNQPEKKKSPMLTYVSDKMGIEKPTTSLNSYKYNPNFTTKPPIISSPKQTISTILTSPPSSTSTYTSPYKQRTYSTNNDYGKTTEESKDRLPKYFSLPRLNSKLNRIPNLNQDSTSDSNKTRKTSLPMTYKNLEKAQQTKSPGILYIFNHDNFESKNLSDRDGSKNDVELLEKTFQKFNVHVEKFQNPKTADIATIMKQIEEKDFSKRSCIVFAILSHGGRNDELYASDGKKYLIHDSIIFRIIKNLSLAKKPKIFIIQACKGSNDPRFYNTDKSDVNCGRPDEILIFLSSFEGFVSYRENNGTPFIREFCSEFDKFGRTTNIQDIMENAKKRVVKKTLGNQTPTTTSTMTTSYVFGNHM